MRIMLVMMMTILLSSMKNNADGNYVVTGNDVDVGKDVEEYDAPLKHENLSRQPLPPPLPLGDLLLPIILMNMTS